MESKKYKKQKQKTNKTMYYGVYNVKIKCMTSVQNSREETWKHKVVRDNI